MENGTNIETTTKDNFIIEMVLIIPISDIISKLENRDFRDCDVKWLENKMENFIEFAAETLNIKIPAVASSEIDSIMNEYTRTRFIERFNTLLDYFKSFK